MSYPAPWVRNIVQDEWGSAANITIGKCYQHPDDGVIRILGGRFWGDHGLSNHWTWEIVATGERKHGYGGEWPEVTPP